MEFVCIGELLWDVFDDTEVLGGAPASVAYHLRRLGVDASLVSRVGADALGARALATLAQAGLNTGLIQIDPSLPTGTAQVALDAGGHAGYRFETPAAWDAIAPPPCEVLGTVVFGSLGQRDGRSRATIRALAKAATRCVFDVNLRPPYDERNLVIESLQLATLVKVNEDELRTIAAWLSIPAREREFAAAIRHNFGTEFICVTRGAEGAALYDAASRYQAAAPAIVPVDTVGAGDAFLAGVLAAWSRDLGWSEALLQACRVAAFVAGQRGAMPVYDAVAQGFVDV